MGAAALTVRVAHWLTLEAYPLTELIRNRLDDQFFYDSWARAILAGRALDLAATGHEFAWWAAHVPGVFPQDPLYPYLLAGLYALFGAEPDAMRVLQALAGTLAAVLVYLTARAFTTRGPALAGGLAVALYGPLVFYEASLLREPLTASVMAGAVFLLIASPRARRRPLLLAFAAGLALGAAVLLRSNVAVVAGGAIAWTAWEGRRSGRGTAPAWAVAAGLALVVGPVLARNSFLCGRPAWISSAGPFSLFVGNAHDASGAGPDATPRYLEVKAAGGGDPGRLVPAALADVRAHPRAWLRLIARKLRLFFLSGQEPPNNLSFAMGVKLNRALTLAPVRYHWIFPAAALGAVVALRQRGGAGLLVLVVALYGASVVAFFVVSRLRLPVVPALALLGAIGLEWIRGQGRGGRRGFALAVGFALVVGGYALRPRAHGLRATDFQIAAAAYYGRGLEEEAAGRWRAARRSYGRAVALNPAHDDALRAAARADQALAAVGEPPPRDACDLCESARQEAQAGRLEEAAAMLEQARRRAPDSALPEHYLANVLYLRGDRMPALEHLERAVALAPANPVLRRNLQRLRAEVLAGPPVD